MPARHGEEHGSLRLGSARSIPTVLAKVATTVDHISAIAERVKGTLAYWDGRTHQHALNLPRFIRQAVDAQTRVVTDAHPLIVS